MLLLGVPGNQSQAGTLAEYARQNPLRLFTGTRGAEMPNAIDQTNNLREGDRIIVKQPPKNKKRQD